MSQEYKNQYVILEFNPQNIWQALKNEWCTEAEAGWHTQARFIYQYLAEPEIDATIILVENNYKDRDYQEDYSAYYVNCGRNYSNVCKRLHFFSLRLPDKAGKKGRPWTEAEFKAALNSMIINGGDETLQENYLGYVVARPLPVAIIGRTMLRAHPDMERTRGRKYCKYDHLINLFGANLRVQSLSSMEQDQTLAACATAALWTCFEADAAMFLTPRLSPNKITKMANEAVQVARVFPTEGLTIDQVVSAIHKNSLEAEVIRIKNQTRIKSILYAYLHYNIPVILVLQCGKDLHAVTVTGYSMDRLKGTEFESTSEDAGYRIPFISSKIDRFFAHDDNVGPYTNFIILRREEQYQKGTKQSRGWKTLIWKQGRVGSGYALWRTPTLEWEQGKEHDQWGLVLKEEPIRFVPLTTVIPVPERIHINALTMQKWIDILSVPILKTTERILSRENLAWDLRMTDEIEWRRELAELFDGQNQRIIELRVEPHPAYIWRATLMAGNKCLLDLLADATDIGGEANPFYQAFFYDPELKEIMSYMFSTENKAQQKRWTSNSQLDEFFYRYFQKYKYSIE